MQEEKGNARAEGTEGSNIELKARTTTSTSPSASSRKRPSSWDDSEVSDDSSAKSSPLFPPVTPREVKIYPAESKSSTEGSSLLLEDIRKEFFRIRGNQSEENPLQEDDLLDRRQSPARIRRRTKSSTFLSSGSDSVDFDDSAQPEKTFLLNYSKRPSFAIEVDLEPRLFLNNFFSDCCPRNSECDESDNEFSSRRKESSDEVMELDAEQVKGNASDEFDLLWDEETSFHEGSPPFWSRTSRKLSQILEIDETKRDLDFSEDENEDSLRIENLLILEDNLTANEEKDKTRGEEETNQCDIDYPLPTTRPTKSHLPYQDKGPQSTSARSLTSRDFPKVVRHSSGSILQEENSMSRVINNCEMTFIAPINNRNKAKICKDLSPTTASKDLDSIQVDRFQKKGLNENLTKKVDIRLEETSQEVLWGLEGIKSECGEDTDTQFLSPKFTIDIEECDSLKSCKASESPEVKTHEKEQTELEREVLSSATHSSKTNSYRKKQISGTLSANNNSELNVAQLSDLKENSKQIKTENNDEMSPKSRNSNLQFQDKLKDDTNNYSYRSQKGLKNIESPATLESDGEFATHHHVLQENPNQQNREHTKSSSPSTLKIIGSRSQTPPNSWNYWVTGGLPLTEKPFTPESPKGSEKTRAETPLNSPWQSARDLLAEPKSPSNPSTIKTKVFKATGITQEEKNKVLENMAFISSMHQEIPTEEPEGRSQEECNYTETSTKLHYCQTKCSTSTRTQPQETEKDDLLVKEPENLRSESFAATLNKCTRLTNSQIIQSKLHNPEESNSLLTCHTPRCEGFTNTVQTISDKQGSLSISQLTSRECKSSSSSSTIENDVKSKGNTEEAEFLHGKSPEKTLQKQLWKNLIDAFDDHDGGSKYLPIQRSRLQNSSIQNLNEPFSPTAKVTGNHSQEEFPNSNQNPSRQPTSSERSDGMVMLLNADESVDETSVNTPTISSLDMNAPGKKMDPIGEFGDIAYHAERGRLSEPDEKPRDHGDGDLLQGTNVSSLHRRKHAQNPKTSHFLETNAIQIDLRASNSDTNTLQTSPKNNAKVVAFCSPKKPKTHHSIFLSEMLPENKSLEATENSISPKTEPFRTLNPAVGLSFSSTPDEFTVTKLKEMGENFCPGKPPETTTATAHRTLLTEHPKPSPNLTYFPQTRDKDNHQGPEPKRWLMVSKRRKPNMQSRHKPKSTHFKPQKSTSSELLHALPSTRRPHATLLHLRKPNCFQTLCHRLTDIFCLTSVSSSAASTR